MREYWAAGGRLIDTSPLYGTAEVSVGDFAAALGVSEQLVIANKVWSTGEYLWDESHARRSLERSLERLWRQTIDIMQCHSLVNVDVVVPILKAWKAEGLVRHIGVTHHEPPYFGVLADWVERGELDVVQGDHWQGASGVAPAKRRLVHFVKLSIVPACYRSDTDSLLAQNQSRRNRQCHSSGKTVYWRMLYGM
jgi:hypothetical protein